jgi:type II secretory pathway pseudopilin PulG
VGLEVSRRPQPSTSSMTGFSLVETLIAALILMVVALGVLPLFSRAMASNLSGSESTSLSNMAASRAEELYQLPFDHPLLTVPVGATEVVTEEVWIDEDGVWIEGTGENLGPGQTATWRRQTRIRQFSVNDLLGDNPTPLDGGIAPGSVQVKEIEVEITTGRQGSIALGPARALRVRLFKAQ